MLNMNKYLLKFYLPLLLLLGVSSTATAQRSVMNMEDHDYKKYYFGITFGYNMSAFKVRPSESFAFTDTFKVIQPRFGAGFHLGIMGNLRLNNFVDLRFIPTIIFSEKKLEITDLNNVISQKSVESIYMHLPLQLKWKSDRIHNFRFYGITGAKFDYDLSSNARSRRTDEFLKVKAIDVGAEVGIGFEFYYPNFIFSPEIKFSQGLMNENHVDPNIKMSNAIDRLNTRMIMFSIHLEG